MSLSELERDDELLRHTVDVTSALAFGEDPNTIERDGDRIQQHLAAIFPMLMKHVLLPWPVWHWLKLPADRRLERDLAAVHAYVGEVIERARARRRDEPRPAGEPPRHVLEAMLDAFEALASEATRLRPVVAFLILDAIGDERLGDLAALAGTQLIFLMRPQATEPGALRRPAGLPPRALDRDGGARRWCARAASPQPVRRRAACVPRAPSRGRGDAARAIDAAASLRDRTRL